jgi:carbonic anhydrase
MKNVTTIQCGKLKGFITSAHGMAALCMAIGMLTAGCATTPQPVLKAEQAEITPAQVLAKLEQGNARFAAGKSLHRDWTQQRTRTAPAQFPVAVVLGCIDSRVSSEIIFDQGLGDIFSARVAGNVLDDDILGSMEFACKVAGAKLIAVIGHSHCGAVKGACSGAQLDHLSGLLEKIRPSVSEAHKELPGVAATDGKFVERVAALHVEHVVKQIREQSTVLRDLIDSGKAGIVGGMYDLDSGIVHFLNR